MEAGPDPSRFPKRAACRDQVGKKEMGDGGRGGDNQPLKTRASKAKGQGLKERWHRESL